MESSPVTTSELIVSSRLGKVSGSYNAFMENVGLRISPSLVRKSELSWSWISLGSVQKPRQLHYQHRIGWSTQLCILGQTAKPGRWSWPCMFVCVVIVVITVGAVVVFHVQIKSTRVLGRLP